MEKQAKGIYLLVIRLKDNQRIRPGKLSEENFKAGIYFYIGKARHGLHRRLKRHLRDEKKLFWHIDYFLKKAKIREIWIKRDSFDECRVVHEVKNLLKNSLFPQRKFGSSDCRCTSHLIYLNESRIDLKSLRKKLSLEKVNIHGNQL